MVTRARRLDSVSATESLHDLYGVDTLADLVVPPLEPLILGRIAPRGGTVLFGPGGARKGTLTCQWIIEYCRDTGSSVLILDYEDHPDEWQPRIVSLGGSDVTHLIHYVPISDPDKWHGRPPPIWNQTEDLKRITDALEPSLIVIDSIQHAVAGDTSGGDTEPPLKYSATLRQLCDRHLSLAHTPKAEKQPLYPFGSQAWHTAARVTWLLVEHEECTSMLYNRKINGGQKLGKRLIEFTYGDGPVSLPVEVWDKLYSETIGDRAYEWLVITGASTTSEITRGLNAEAAADGEEDEAKRIKEDSVSRALRRQSKGRSPRFRQDGSSWTAIS